MKTYYLMLLMVGGFISANADPIDKMTRDTVLLQTVVVTGTRTPKILGNSPISTRVITADEIKKIDATHIGELLQQEIPGIEFSYSMNQQVSLNMQGFGGSSVLFLQDGERMAGETLDNVDYYRLNLDNVERIEIVKGAASSLYGSNAVGGVINIISKKSSKAWSANANVRFGAYGEQRYGVSAGINSGHINNMANVQHTDVDEIKLKHSGDYSKIFANRTWNFKDRLIYTYNDKLNLTARAGYFFRECDMLAEAKNRYRDFCGGLKGNYTFTRKDNLELAYAFDQYDKSDYVVKNHNDIRDYSNVQHSARVLFNHTFDKDKTLSVGGDVMRDYLMSYQFTDNGNKTQYTYDAFAQIDAQLTSKLDVIAGLRYDYYSKAKSNRLSTKLGLMYKLGLVNLRMAYSGGFRAPTLKEMYMNFNMANIFMIYGNEKLKSETSDNFSLSADYRRQNYDFELTGFYNLVSNRITTAWNQSLKGMKYINMADMKVAGINANVSARYACGLRARMSYAYTYEHIKSGEPLVSATRPHTATMRIEYDRKWKNYGFCLSLSGRYLSRVTADEYTSYTSYETTEKKTYTDYSIWKLSLLQRVCHGIDVTMAVDNLFNYVPGYYYNNSPTTRGTVFSAGVSIEGSSKN